MLARRARPRTTHRGDYRARPGDSAVGLLSPPTRAPGHSPSAQSVPPPSARAQAVTRTECAATRAPRPAPGSSGGRSPRAGLPEQPRRSPPMRAQRARASARAAGASRITPASSRARRRHDQLRPGEHLLHVRAELAERVRQHAVRHAEQPRDDRPSRRNTAPHRRRRAPHEADEGGRATSGRAWDYPTHSAPGLVRPVPASRPGLPRNPQECPRGPARARAGHGLPLPTPPPASSRRPSDRRAQRAQEPPPEVRRGSRSAA